VGLDVCKAKNVDVVVSDFYDWKEIEDNSQDFIITANALEHIEFPWLTMEQIYKKLKSNGIACVIAPNFAFEHRYPLDCYRYFADGLVALAKWAKFQIINITVGGVPNLYADSKWDDIINDCMGILIKSDSVVDVSKYPKLEIERRVDVSQYYKLEIEEVLNVKFERTIDILKKDNTLRLLFMEKWIKLPNKDLIIQNFILCNNIKFLIIYGFGIIGRMLYSYFKNFNINIFVMDEHPELISEIKAIKTGDNFSLDNNVYMLVTVLDSNRVLIKHLNELYDMPKCYVDEILL